MTSTPDQPMSRRAAREAARLASTGEVAPLPEETGETNGSTGSTGEPGRPFGVPQNPVAVPTFPAPAAPSPSDATGETNAPPALGEPPATTGLVGIDGQPLSRRRLREQRETQSTPVVGDQQGTGPAPSATGPAPASTGAAPSVTGPAPTAMGPAPSAAGAASAVPTFPAPTPPATSAGPQPTPNPPFLSTQPMTPVPAQPVAPAGPQAPSAGQPVWTAPQGHWTRQLAQQDDDDVELTASREVGGSPQTTSSILVVDHPAVLDLGGPLNATGEVLLTGSIPLSQTFARTGTVGAIDGAELDDRFDNDRAPDAQPVKASAVASQHALGSPIVANAPRRGGRGMTALLVSASVLAVLVTGLVVTAIVLGWFHP